MEGEPESNIAEQRKEKALGFLISKKNYLVWVVLAAIAGIGYWIRTRNLPLLIDITTGKYIPSDPDAFGFLRYVQYLYENGSLMAVDTLRYYPFGYSNLNEFSFLSHFIVYLYKFLHLFSSTITLEYVDVIYPAIAFVIGLVFFFLFVREVFDWRVGLLASAFLTVLPAYLFRTMTGVSDKEALAMTFMFMALYFFVGYLKRRNLTQKLVFAGLGGLSAGLMGLIWGGINFLFLTFGITIIICLIFNRIDKRDIYGYTFFLIVFFSTLIIGYPEKYGIFNLIGSITSSVTILALAVVWINLLLQKETFRNIIKERLPTSIVSLLIVIVLYVIYGFIDNGAGFLSHKISDVWINFVNTPTSRWILTVAESHQSYFTDIISQFGWLFIIMFFLGGAFVFYEIFKNTKEKYYLSTGFLAFIMIFAMSRYSTGSIFNGSSNIFYFVYTGSLVLFVLGMGYYYFRNYYKDKENFSKLQNIDKSYVFVLVLFFFLLMGAMAYIRLVFSFTPITAILASFAVFFILDNIGLFKEKAYKSLVIIGLVILCGFLLYSFYNSTLVQAQYTGPGYNQQWQVGMEWVRENTQEDAVFGHWWDYGYWVMGGSGRATIADGGNAMGALNYYIGRHILTADNETEMLQYMKARGVTHLLMVNEEIGKYGAYSSIGSDENYDRYSWIVNYNLDMTQMQETRNGTILVYTGGGSALDEDLIYQDKIFPRGNAGIAGFIIPVVMNGSEMSFDEQPVAILYYQGQQYNIPLRAIFFNNEEYIFDDEEEYLEGCLMLIPKIDGDQMNAIGSSLYLSPRVYKASFARTYLMDRTEEFPHLKLVYNDNSSMPLALYNGRMIGPMKIWEVSYPEDLEVPEYYYRTDLINPNVTKV